MQQILREGNDNEIDKTDKFEEIHAAKIEGFPKKEMARRRFAFLPLKLSQFYFVYNLQLQLTTQAKSRRQNGRVARNH